MTTSTPSSESAPLKSKKVMGPNGRIYYQRDYTNQFVDPEKFPLDTTKCGRRSNYLAHRKRAEWPCDPCSEANRQYHRNWRQLRKLIQTVKVAMAKLEETEGDTKDEREQGDREVCIALVPEEALTTGTM